MLITRTSMITGVTRTLDIDCTEEQLMLWAGGALIQRAMPHLSADDREFIMTGITPEEWAEVFSDEEEDDDYDWEEEPAF